MEWVFVPQQNEMLETLTQRVQDRIMELRAQYAHQHGISIFDTTVDLVCEGETLLVTVRPETLEATL